MDPTRHRRERGTPKNTWCSDLEAVTNKTELHLAGSETLKLIPTRWGYTWRRDLEADTNKMGLNLATETLKLIPTTEMGLCLAGTGILKLIPSRWVTLGWRGKLEACTNKMGLHLPGTGTLKLIPARWDYSWKQLERMAQDRRLWQIVVYDLCCRGRAEGPK